MTFQRTFRLAGFESAQPPGDYLVETDEQVLDTVTRLALRRIETRMEICPRPGITETVPIDPVELERELLRDAEDGAAI